MPTRVSAGISGNKPTLWIKASRYYTFQGPAQLSRRLQYGKAGEARPCIFSHMSDIRMKKVRGCTGLRTAKRAKVLGSLLHISSLWEATILHTEHCECSQLKIRESSANFHHFLNTSCSREKRYQTFLYCKWLKARQGLGMRLYY